MSIQDLGSIGELVAAIATVGTLLYLAIQIRQNTRAVRGATLHAIQETWQSELHWSHEISAIWVKVIGDPAQLTAAEAHSMNVWLISSLTGRQNEYFQYRRGLLDEELWETSEAIIRILMSIPHMKEWWSVQGRAVVTSSFASHVDRLVAEGSPLNRFEPHLTPGSDSTDAPPAA